MEKQKILERQERLKILKRQKTLGRLKIPGRHTKDKHTARQIKHKKQTERQIGRQIDRQS